MPPQLWDLETGEVLLQLFQKAFNRDAWPAIQLSADEALAFHAQPNAVNVYNPRDFAAGVAQCRICTATRICLLFCSLLPLCGWPQLRPCKLHTRC